MKINGHLAYLLTLSILVGCNVKAINTDGDLIANHQNQKNEFTLITSPNQNYLNGDTIVFVLSFPKSVDVTGIPRFNLDIGGVMKTANYVSGTGTTQLHFEYTVTGADIDTDGIAVTSSILLDAGALLNYDVSSTCGTNINVPDLSTVRVNSSP